MHDIINRYTPKGHFIRDGKGTLPLAHSMWREAVAARELIWMLFLRDCHTRYRQSVLGVIWAVLTPLIAVAMFSGMNRSGILIIQDVGTPYPLYAVLGLSIWSLFAIGLSACTSSLINAGSLIVKINFPKVALVVAASGQGVVELLIRLVLTAFVFLYYGTVPSLGGMLIGVLLLLPMYLMMLGIGLILSLIAGVIRDVVSLLNIVLAAILLLTPILYPVGGNTPLASANAWNPFNYLVNVPRDFILKGRTQFMNEFFWAALLAATIFLIGWRFFYLAQRKIAERI